MDLSPGVQDSPSEIDMDEDEMEWEEAGVELTKKEEKTIRDDAPIDVEAARLADLESDIRKPSGWRPAEK